MGRYLNPGHSYNDGDTITGPSLTEHVSESTFKPTAITEQTLKTPAALTDQLLVVASGAFFQETLQQIHDLILYPGSTVQTAYQEFTAFTVISAVLPFDDTIPQNTEGTEIISLSITPRFATSTILCRFQGFGDANPLTTNVVALFRGGNVNALAATCAASTNPGYNTAYTIEYMDSPATTSPVTYTIRAGPGGGQGISTLMGKPPMEENLGVVRGPLWLSKK